MSLELKLLIVIRTARVHRLLCWRRRLLLLWRQRRLLLHLLLVRLLWLLRWLLWRLLTVRLGRRRCGASIDLLLRRGGSHLGRG